MVMEILSQKGQNQFFLIKKAVLQQKKTFFWTMK